MSIPEGALSILPVSVFVSLTRFVPCTYCSNKVKQFSARFLFLRRLWRTYNRNAASASNDTAIGAYSVARVRARDFSL